jgi:hypothetical protein
MGDDVTDGDQRRRTAVDCADPNLRTECPAGRIRLAGDFRSQQ